jgi:filamentous hemagglutinin family protein
MQRKWKRRWQRLTKAILPPMAAGLLFLSAYSPALANPAGGTVVSGSAAITSSGSTMTINQTTNKAILNWQSFSIGKGETVNFVQPGAGSVALNRVIGSDASSIYGNLNANGKVYLVNPNGVLFAPGSSVNVGGLVASTLKISDSDFLKGNYTLQKDGNVGSVVSQGTITAANEAVLIGPKVANEGVIAAKVTGLAAGNKVSMDFSGDNLLNVTVDTGAAGGSATNTGTITATGGLVVMSAGTKDALLNTVVNNSGVIQAQNVTNVGGVIRLEGNTVSNSGTLDASGKAAGQTGGTVKLLGDTVTLKTGSTIDVSGGAGGGNALIGGAYQGGSSEYAATHTTVQSGAVINADAITSGNGGSVVVWANDTTNFAGTITARGGAVSGDGGSTEVSGKKTLVYQGHTDTTAVNGKTGNLLLDPGEYTISTGATGGNVKNVDELVTELGSTNITLATDGTGTGDVTVSAPVSWSSANTLTLSAHNNIYLNSSITATNGGLTLAANTAGSGNGITTGIITPAAGSSINVETFTLQSGTWQEINSSLSSFYAKDFRISGGTFLRAKGGDGTSASPYQIADVYGLQGIGSSGMLGKNYMLANSIVASGTQYWNSGAGFVPIGNGSTCFTGSLDGGGYAITGLTIDRSSTDYVGLFGNFTGIINNIGLSGGSVIGKSYVGGLVGYNSQGKIENSYNTGMVTGASDVGGLTGINKGWIANSYSTGAVNGTGGNIFDVGGLVGRNAAGGKIANSYSTGVVKGAARVGGLVGFNSDSTITNSYSTGTVTGGVDVGGLAGWNLRGTITNSNSTGTVTGGSDVGGLVGVNGDNPDSGTIISCYSTGAVNGSSNVGGLVGANGGSITSSYSTGEVTGGSSSEFLGGLVGLNYSSGKITNDYSWSKVTGSQTVGGLVGSNYGEIKNSYSTGAVRCSYNVGGLVGYNNYNITNCYWDVDTSGVSTGFGGKSTFLTEITGLTTAQMKQSTDFRGWDIARTGGSNSVWRIYEGYTYPLLRNFLKPLTVSTGATKVYDGTAYSGSSGLTYSLSNVNTSLIDYTHLNYTGDYIGKINAGTYSFDVNGLASSQQGYDISYGSGTLTITPRNITVTANNVSKMYGEANPTGGMVTLTSGSLVGSDALGSATLNSPATTTSSVGDYTLTPSGVNFTSGNASNYNISYANGTLIITPRNITIKANNASKTYGEANPTSGMVTLTSGSLVGSDSINSTASLSSTATATSSVGDYILTPSGVNFTSGNASNYNISYANGTLTITPRPITVTANTSRIYGEANPVSGAVTLISGSLVGSDALGSASLNSTATTTSSVGDYTLTPSGVNFTSGNASNYVISYANGTLTITPRPITVTANTSRIYGEANPVSGAVTLISGSLVGSDALGSASLNSTATTTSSVGDYTLTPSGVSFIRGSASNYNISYANGTLTITPRPITVTANTSKIYGEANPVSGAVTLISGSLVGSDALGSASLNSPATTTSSVGDYTLTPSGVNFTSGNASNYVISYANGTLTITPRPITVIANTSRIYGEANPVGGMVTLTSGSLVGSDALGSATLNSPATTTSSVGDYTLTPSGVNFTSGNASNYNISYANGTLTITPRNITVTPMAGQSKIYGQSDPVLAYSITNGSIVNGDTLVGGLAYSGTDVGNYLITQGTLTSVNNANYTITYSNPAATTFVITPAHLNVRANDATRWVGASNPAFSAIYTGLVGGDTPASLNGTLVFSTPAAASSGPGSYAITPSGLSSGNYSITFVDGVLTVTRVADPYTGAVITADRTVYGGGTGILFKGFTGISGLGNTGLRDGINLLLTIVPPGVNIGGFQPGNENRE